MVRGFKDSGSLIFGTVVTSTNMESLESWYFNLFLMYCLTIYDELSLITNHLKPNDVFSYAVLLSFLYPFEIENGESHHRNYISEIFQVKHLLNLIKL